MKIPRRIIKQFGEVKIINRRYKWPYTQVAYFENNLALLKIQDLSRDGYKRDWYKFIGSLIYEYHGRKYLYLVVEKFDDLEQSIEDKIIHQIQYYLGFYDEHDYYMRNCLESTLSAVNEVGYFLNAYPQYRNKQYDFSYNLMIRKNGNFVFCDPLV